MTIIMTNILLPLPSLLHHHEEEDFEDFEYFEDYDEDDKNEDEEEMEEKGEMKKGGRWRRRRIQIPKYVLKNDK